MKSMCYSIHFCSAINSILHIFHLQWQDIQTNLWYSNGLTLIAAYSRCRITGSRGKSAEKNHISFYHRYVDDIILAAPFDQMSMILDTFNNFHNRLQFTMEFENDRKLNFLDLMMKVNNIVNLN